MDLIDIAATPNDGKALVGVKVEIVAPPGKYRSGHRYKVGTQLYITGTYPSHVEPGRICYETDRGSLLWREDFKIIGRDDEKAR